MKKIILLVFLILFFSCDDGNFEAPGFNFDQAPIENCGNLLLFKINDSEALILELNIDNTDNIFFQTEHTSESFELTDKVYYRTYNANIPTDYFCSNIPPAEPTLTKEWKGSGTLIVNNTITEDNGTFTYLATFTINDMTLTNSNGNSIVYDTYDFGSVSGSY